MVSLLNSPTMYLICGSIVLFVAIVCLIFLIRAYRTGKAIGMDTTKMKRAIIASATFSILPSVGILMGVIALSGSLGTPYPWLRLSVIGALHYETQVAEAAGEAAGLSKLSMAEMTPEAFVTIAFLMSACIIWGMFLAIFFSKKYLNKLKTPSEKKSGSNMIAAFGDQAMTAMFIGLVTAYIGSYIGKFISGNGVFTFSGSLLPFCVAVVSGLAMAGFLYLIEKKKIAWLESFSIAGSMLIAMASAILLGQWL